MFPGHGGGWGVLPPGVQGEGEGGADGKGEGEGLPLVGQRLAKVQALGGQGWSSLTTGAAISIGFI